MNIIFLFCWVSLGPLGPGYVGDVNQINFILILYISGQQLASDLYFVGFTLILYISCQQLGGLCNLLGVFGPFGPRVGGLYVFLCLHWYCIYHVNNWGKCVICWLSLGPSGPEGRGVYVNWCTH